MTGLFAVIGGFVVRFRWAVVVVWLAAAAAASPLPSLAAVTQSDNTAFLPSSAASQQAVRLAGPLVTAGATTVIAVVARPASELTAADRAAIGRMMHEMSTVRNVIAVRDASISPDERAEQFRILARLDASGGGQAEGESSLVSSLRAVMNASPLPSGLERHLAGAVAAAADSNATSGGVSKRVQDLSLLFVVLLLTVVFRSVLAPLVAVAPSLLVVFIASRLTAEISVHGLQVSAIASLLQIVLVIGAGTDYALFLMFRVRETLTSGVSEISGARAVTAAVAHVGEPLTFSAGTVIAAVLSLLAATFPLYSALAVPLAIGVGLMLLAGLTLVPASLALLGPAVFWPAAVRREPGPETEVTRGTAPDFGGWGKLAVRVTRRPLATLIVSTLAFGALGFMSSGYTAAGIGGSVMPPAGSDSAAGDALLAAHFPQTSLSATLIVFRFRQSIWTRPSALAIGQRMIATDGLFSAVSGPLDPSGVALSPAEYSRLHADLGPPAVLPTSPPAGARIPGGLGAYQAYRASGQYVSPDGRIIAFGVTLAAGGPETTAATHAVPAIRMAAARTAAAIGATAFGVAGRAASGYDIAQISDGDLRTVIPVAVAVLAILLALVTRSLVAPLYLIGSIVLSYFAALGMTVLIFIKLLAQPGLSFVMPFLLFVFLLALGEDYNILVMARIREEARHEPLRAAIARALEATGTTVTSAGLVLAGTFGVFAFAGSSGASQETVLQAGIGLALGILADTFVVRTLLVPSVVALLGAANWWPSRHGTAYMARNIQRNRSGEEGSWLDAH